MKNILILFALFTFTSLFSQSNGYREANPETVVGGTIYDLQTNGSNQRRIINHDDGTISLCWMWSQEDLKNPKDRGTGYNYYNGSSWTINPDDIVNALESKKTGWPNMLTTNSGKEIIISHSSIDTALVMLSRNSKGGGAWTEKTLFAGYKLIWSRAVTGGPDGNTIHLIAVTADVKGKGTKFKGIDGALLYSRSTDGGTNWTTPDILPPIDSTFSLSISGDSYSIDAKGNDVAILIGDSWSDVALVKSTDNGINWTKTTIYDFPYDLFDEKTTLTPDTPQTSDGFTSVLLDNNGKAHAWYGNMRVLNSKVNDDTLVYFRGTSGLLYWNETEPSPKIIVGIADLDFDSSGTYILANGELSTYNCGLTSMPTSGIDNDGNIYVILSALLEEFVSAGQQNYRHLIAIKSEDGGASWSKPNDITPSTEDPYREYVYPSMAKLVDDHLHIIALEDEEPGLAVSGENDGFNINNLMYLKVSTKLNVEVQEIITKENSASVFPNPVSENQVRVSFPLEKSGNVQIHICDVLGKRISTQSYGKKDAGQQQLTISTEGLTAGIYFVQIIAGSDKITKQLLVK